MREPIESTFRTDRRGHLEAYVCGMSEVRALEKYTADIERKLSLAKEGLSEIVEVAADDPYEAYRIAENILSEIEK